MENKGAKISIKSFITSFAIIFALMITAGILTQTISPGEYQRNVNDNGIVEIVPDTYEHVYGVNYNFFRVFTAPFEILFTEDAPIVIMISVFILIISGAISIMRKTGLLDYIINKVTLKYIDKRYKLMGIIILIFMLFGALLGIFEETIPLIPIIVSLSYALGWDIMTGLGMSLIAAGFGFSSSIANPFSTGIAQQIAGLPLFSGMTEVLPGVLLIFMAMSVKHIIISGKIMDTLLYGISNIAGISGQYTGTVFIFSVILFLNLFVGSASAKAFLTLPVLIPLSDLMNITRQTTVLAFTLGDGFTNLIYPTNAVLLIALGITGVSYSKWFKFIWKIELLMIFMSLFYLFIASKINYGPF